MSILLLIILVAVIIFLGLYAVLATDFIVRRHDLPTSRNAMKTIFGIVSDYKPGAHTFYDLGCGRGTLAIATKKQFPRISVHALDYNAVRIFFAKSKSFILRRKISYERIDIFEADLSNADIIYTYLWYDLMPPLEKKLQKELKKGAMVITNTSNFPTWEPSGIYITRQKHPEFERLFVYIKD